MEETLRLGISTNVLEKCINIYFYDTCKLFQGEKICGDANYFSQDLFIPSALPDKKSSGFSASQAARFGCVPVELNGNLEEILSFRGT